MIKFSPEFLGGLDGDPAVLLEIPNHRGQFLFDLGSLDGVVGKALLKIRWVFISHTHIDHFIGFDRLLRVNIPHGRELFLAGPKGFASNVQGKLTGYTWNLLDEDQLCFRVVEVHDCGRTIEFRLKSSNGFQLEKVSERDDYVVLEQDRVTVRGVPVDHGIASIAYRLSVESSPKVDVAKLAESSLKPGPWVSEIQKRMIAGVHGSIQIDGSTHDAKDLVNQFFSLPSSVSFGYVTDMAFSKKNLELLEKLGRLDVLVCEASFRVEDRKRAQERGHLTTKQAALIAVHLGASTLKVFHISQIYGGDTHLSLKEAEGYFTDFRKLSKAEVSERIHQESV